MRISIRPDYCIALRMIAIQEWHRKNIEFLESEGLLMDLEDEELDEDSET